MHIYLCIHVTHIKCYIYKREIDKTNVVKCYHSGNLAYGYMEFFYTAFAIFL